MDVPVLCLFFNRPDKVERLLKRLREIKPSILFISCDGPRDCQDLLLIDEIKELIKVLVNWPCDLKIKFEEKNLGCKEAVIKGINWFFQTVESGIILEDDCVPSDDFFEFCKHSLLEFKNDPRIYHISGTRFNNKNFGQVLYLSDYPLMWGWATWRDRWSEYSAESKGFVKILFRKWGRRPIVFLYWLLVAKSVYSNKVDTWDVQWMLTVWKNGGLSVRPSVNLVKNIGFDEFATHTRVMRKELVDMAIARLNISTSMGVYYSREIRNEDERLWAQISLYSLVRMILNG